MRSSIGPDFNRTENPRIEKIERNSYRVLNYTFLLLSLILCTSLFAQNNNSQHVYKFSVDGIETRQDAKFLMYDLHGHSDISSLTFINDCQCFKLTSDQARSYSFLEALISDYGYSISEKIHSGDGQILVKEIELQEELQTE